MDRAAWGIPAAAHFSAHIGLDRVATTT